MTDELLRGRDREREVRCSVVRGRGGEGGRQRGKMQCGKGRGRGGRQRGKMQCGKGGEGDRERYITN